MVFLWIERCHAGPGDRDDDGPIQGGPRPHGRRAGTHPGLAVVAEAVRDRGGRAALYLCGHGNGGGRLDRLLRPAHRSGLAWVLGYDTNVFLWSATRRPHDCTD